VEEKCEQNEYRKNLKINCALSAKDKDQSDVEWRGDRKTWASNSLPDL